MLFVHMLLEVDLRLSLKCIMVVNVDDDCLVLLSYDKLFEVCFYCGRRRVDGHSFPADEDNEGCLVVDRIFEDEPSVCPAEVPFSDETRNELHEGVMLFFPQPVLVDEVVSGKGDNPDPRDHSQDHAMDESEGWSTIVLRKNKSSSRNRGGVRRDGKTYGNVVRENKTWVSKANLVPRWRPTGDKDVEAMTATNKEVLQLLRTKQKM
ncbi:hypothetical protein ACFX2F_006812 [Malus domestica]